MRAVLDTSVVLAGDIGELDGELAISAATLAELHFGVLVARGPAVRAERLRRLTLLERQFDPIPVDGAVAAAYGQLAAAVAAAGRRPRARGGVDARSAGATRGDLLIAATAHAHGARLYTRNAEDLRGLAELMEIVPV